MTPIKAAWLSLCAGTLALLVTSCGTFAGYAIGSAIETKRRTTPLPPCVSTDLEPGQTLVVQLADGSRLSGSFVGVRCQADSVLLLARSGNPVRFPDGSGADTLAIPWEEVQWVRESGWVAPLVGTAVGLTADILFFRMVGHAFAGFGAMGS